MTRSKIICQKCRHAIKCRTKEFVSVAGLKYTYKLTDFGVEMHVTGESIVGVTEVIGKKTIYTKGDRFIILNCNDDFCPYLLEHLAWLSAKGK